MFTKRGCLTSWGTGLFGAVLLCTSLTYAAVQEIIGGAVKGDSCAIGKGTISLTHDDSLTFDASIATFLTTLPIH